jgi:hypothetical protein
MSRELIGERRELERSKHLAYHDATPPDGGSILTALTVLTRLTALTADSVDIVDVVDGESQCGQRRQSCPQSIPSMPSIRSMPSKPFASAAGGRSSLRDRRICVRSIACYLFANLLGL